jgi:hypothetical protein
MRRGEGALVRKEDGGLVEEVSSYRPVHGCQWPRSREKSLSILRESFCFRNALDTTPIPITVKGTGDSGSGTEKRLKTWLPRRWVLLEESDLNEQAQS